MASRVGLDRRTVIETAIRLADEEGFDSLTLISLARRLGIRSQSLYAHVDGLDGLRRDLQIEHHRRAGERARAVSAGLAGRPALLALVRDLAAFHREHPGLLAAVGRAVGDDSELWQHVEQAGEPMRRALGSFGLDEDAVNHWERIIWTSVHGFGTLRNAGMMRLPSDPDESLEIMLTAFVNELERPSAPARPRRARAPRSVRTHTPHRA